MTRTCLALLFVAGLSVGCSEKSKSKSESSPSAPKTATAAAAVDPDASLTAKQKLALAKLTGVGGADTEVTAAQKSVRDNLQKDDAWITLGRAWIRKARESNDPGFYLNADACASVASS